MSDATEENDIETPEASDLENDIATDADGAETAPEEVVEELDPLQKAEAEANQWKDRALRNQAELENFRKRSAREKTDAIRYANSSLLIELFPILDNFDMGLTAAKQESADSIITQGMSMVHKQMQDFLESQNVKRLADSGQKFDPNLHEAVSQEFSDDVPEGDIIHVLRPGYQMQERLLRAATVVVSKGPNTGEEETEQSD